MGFDKYCNECKGNKYVVGVFDKNHNKLKVKPIEVGFKPNSGHHLRFQVEDMISIFTLEDLEYLRYLLGAKLEYGATSDEDVGLMLKYAELYEKIDKEIK